MYLPRHHESKTKSNSNFGLVLILLLIFSSVGVLIWKWNQIRFYFSGNSKLKISKVEDSINENLDKGKIPKNLISEFKNISNIYFEASPTDSSANFYLAKSYYFEVFNSLKFENIDIIRFNSLNSNYKIFESIKLKNDFETMYRTALRASAFDQNFSEKEENKILIYLYEGLNQKKNRLELSTELNKIEYNKLSKQMKKLYLSLCIISIPSSGNIEFLENFFNLNETEKNYTFTKEEISFLKGVNYFNKKDYVKALELFRESKAELNPTTIEATRYEADIFFKQNLHEKAILILEDLYKNTGSTNEKIIIQIKEIISTKPNLKSKLDI